MSEPYNYQSFLLSRPNGVRSEFNKVSGIVFRDRVIELRAQHPIYMRTLHLHDNYDRFDCRIGATNDYGCAVTHEGELTNVFSCVRGGGRMIMESVMRDYEQLHLNCFAETEAFYAQAGFVAVHREPNWDSTEHRPLPDVVFMQWKRTP